jgi:acyl carrier protein
MPDDVSLNCCRTRLEHALLVEAFRCYAIAGSDKNFPNGQFVTRVMPKRRQGIVVMTEQEIFVRFAALIEEYSETSASDVTPEADLADDLGFDSLSMVEIVISAETAFDIEIPDEVIRDLETVQDVVNYVRNTQRADMPA